MEIKERRTGRIEKASAGAVLEVIMQRLVMESA
jgi:hypothetical protein